MSSFTIQLQNLRFSACHGFYDDEKILPNAFEVNISIRIKAPQGKKSGITDTVNYATVYQVVKEIFYQQEELLENICIKIANAVKDAFPGIKRLSVQVIKLHPPITAFTGSVNVTFEKKYN